MATTVLFLNPDRYRTFKSHELAQADLTLESLEEKDKVLKFLNLS